MRRPAGLRRLRSVPALAIVLVLAAPGALGASVARKDPREQLREQIGEASQQEQAAIAQLQDIQARKAQIDAQVAQLDTQLADAQAKLAPLEAEEARLAAQYQALQQRIAETQARLDVAQQKLDESAAGLYRSERRGAGYDSILATQPHHLISQQQYLDRVADERRGIVSEVKAARKDLRQQRRVLAVQKQQADAAAAQARAVRDQIASLRAQIEPARQQAANEQYLEQQQLNQIQANKASYEAQLAQMQALSDFIAAKLRARGGSGGGAPCEARPVPGAIVSGFGMRYHPILHYYRMHTGDDMHASEGTPIHACRGGTVVIAGWNGGYGNCVVIDHGGGMATLYGHQSRIAVHEGETVSAGQVIGYVGHTGMATGPHLHFEVRINGNPVDPAPYL